MTQDKIEQIKCMAIRANARGDWLTLCECCKWLDEHWHDDRAAYAFYTSLERSAPASLAGETN